MEKQIPCKIVIAGDGGTGKSTLIAAKNTGEFNYASNITIGVDFACLNLEFNNEVFPFLIYDLGVQQRFQFLHDTYITGSKGAIVMYDLTRRKTFENIRKWEPKTKATVHGIMTDSLAALSTNMEMDNDDGDKMGMRRGKECDLSHLRDVWKGC